MLLETKTQSSYQSNNRLPTKRALFILQQVLANEAPDNVSKDQLTLSKCSGCYVWLCTSIDVFIVFLIYFYSCLYMSITVLDVLCHLPKVRRIIGVLLHLMSLCVFLMAMGIRDDQASQIFVWPLAIAPSTTAGHRWAGGARWATSCTIFINPRPRTGVREGVLRPVATGSAVEFWSASRVDLLCISFPITLPPWSLQQGCCTAAISPIILPIYLYLSTLLLSISQNSYILNDIAQLTVEHSTKWYWSARTHSAVLLDINRCTNLL